MNYNYNIQYLKYNKNIIKKLFCKLNHTILFIYLYNIILYILNGKTLLINI
jgi:hypothetical protein